MGRFFNKGDRVYEVTSGRQDHGTVTETDRGIGANGNQVQADVRFDDDGSVCGMYTYTIRHCDDGH
ncbi:hypothetical protein [Streptomyces sp. NPDC020917]|uniref:hypothetical protein n=1 Tax=Streptomyces sp. NPDC020917 TaxID=3365102 RepID=UPI00378B68A8